MNGAAPAVEDRLHDAALVARLHDGDEAAFQEAVVALYPAMLSIARGYVREPSVAEEVVQEAWVGVLTGLDRFEGRSTLRVWILQIVANIARDRAVREARSRPFSSFETADDEPAVQPDRFLTATEPFPGGWRSFPSAWQTLPEPRLLARETLSIVASAIEELPSGQRLVVTLRDVIGCAAGEVCGILDISDGNQRVLLHRARARIRARLERHFDG